MDEWTKDPEPEYEEFSKYVYYTDDEMLKELKIGQNMPREIKGLGYLVPLPKRKKEITKEEFCSLIRTDRELEVNHRDHRYTTLYKGSAMYGVKAWYGHEDDTYWLVLPPEPEVPKIEKKPSQIKEVSFKMYLPIGFNS